MVSKGIGSAVYLAQFFVAEAVNNGGTAVDATAGNGNDTLFLARLVGEGGKVYAFDTQAKALQITQELLKNNGCMERVELLQAGHEKMRKLVPGPVDAVMFNLGYLPGGDHSIVTQPLTTLKALGAALELLRTGGRIGLVIYTGHPGGREEAETVEKFISSLNADIFKVIKISFVNRAANAPVVIVIEKDGA
ncbi:class I SAM-dependent methyltransferase [Pelotomaculum propionicicum]|uniref:Ubiquinone/menaquinone biosynthesis C-methyltransferase UbiE n=1 Tax=Pelotomaculum propionicicum TaxID=258475 RepID=A0A4Y7RMT1_9FIRM|nr:class I SAM-dependent methyltransferase [Pelotomaculum propionicicum]NLI12389.1 methyltransferase domain-containing protein [Peptococcaceae bacterium]TEB10049.1 Ubiquinone/menaquinone biosynthesis C-methyltransferase UbiE [Pelotomaculum propionicicum]